MGVSGRESGLEFLEKKTCWGLLLALIILRSSVVLFCHAWPWVVQASEKIGKRMEAACRKEVPHRRGPLIDRAPRVVGGGESPEKGPRQSRRKKRRMDPGKILGDNVDQALLQN